MNLIDTFGMIETRIVEEGGTVMSFIKKIKDSASRVTEKAQNSVEIGKLNGLISDVEQEMEVEFTKMGRLFYDGYRSKDMSVAEGKMVELSRNCSKLQEKIEVLRTRIAELKNERLCSCGHIVALDANFCPKCGSKLEPLSASRKVPPTPVFVQSVNEDDEDQYYGADELTDEEKEIAMKLHPQSVVYAEVQHLDDELPFEEYKASEQDIERERKQADQLERERKRQLELDRRFGEWHKNEHQEESAVTEDNGVRDMIQCQICRNELPKGSLWCPRCGSEQI
jgi:RNA polymerase subunit RPABC4/transcription elongation factor Spt4